MIHDVRGIHRLLSYWGGESIYWKHCEGAPEVAAKLRSLGTPAIVTALLDFTAPGVGTRQVFPSLIHVFVGKALGHEPADADVLYRAPIPSQRIESIVSPGDLARRRQSSVRMLVWKHRCGWGRYSAWWVPESEGHFLSGPQPRLNGSRQLMHVRNDSRCARQRLLRQLLLSCSRFSAMLAGPALTARRADISFMSVC
ncbi:hypothetical protein [Streptomyces sp. NBC_01578]|uniref:hypothetical protein n=1 Tax=Streptomyces sp. NBC_01578 TaxID=2975884 RepID=UPI003865DB72